ncbi:peptidyl-prolyl cis-trans isomerase [bacterium]|nr:MAG: peptidyl-prolyl cis-trans isomerase [bacterium]
MANPKVLLKTNFGNITLELDEKNAPKTVDNFLNYALEGFYDGTIFHRVIPGFMIQGGGFSADFVQKPTKAPIKNEATNGLTNMKGMVAMARTSEVDSATAQFFINTVNNPFLNHKSRRAEEFGYCVFGWVSEGMDVVEKIEKVKTSSRGMHGDVPVDAVVIESVECL